METKPAQNIQDTFLNTARKERTNITIYLLSGVKLTGRIRSFDKYSVVLDTNNQEQLIFKHAISTVAMGKTLHSHGEKPAALAASVGAPASGEAVAMPRPLRYRRLKGRLMDSIWQLAISIWPKPVWPDANC
jgi:host factor-I protein